MIISAETWKLGPVPTWLGPGEVHLWRASLNRNADRLADCAAVLSEEERVRAERFRFDRDRNMYVLSRGVLRLLLSSYTGLRADAISFRYGSQGKPFLEGDGEIEFNVSHSGGLCAFAFTRGMRVGVDIEEKSREVAFLELAERFFSREERNGIAEVRQAELRDAFYAVWTRKEAYIKGLGEGVTHGLDNFTVTVHPDEPSPRVTSRRDPDAAKRWSITTFEPAPDFAGALAAEGAKPLIKTLDYDGTQSG